MISVRFVEKPTFWIVGREGSGESGGKWVRDLWDEANAHFGEVAALAVVDRLGKPQIWGAMSRFERDFRPWDARGGLYLAGCEVAADAEAPDGWTKWEIPGSRYAVAEYTEGSYGEVLDEVLHDYFPKNGFKLVGAIHEFYPPSGALELWFPVERI